MCMWVRAMDTYSKVIKIVEPKRMSLRSAQEALQKMNSALDLKQIQLKEIEDKVGKEGCVRKSQRKSGEGEHEYK